MAKEITEDEVQAFLVKLKAADNDKKVDQIQFFGLKLEDATTLPENTLDAITQTIAPLLRSTSHLLVTSTLSHFLTLYIPLLPPSPQRHLQLSLVQLLPPLLEKLNDPKDRTHTAAAGCISLLGKRCYEAESSAQGLNGSAKGKEKEGLVGMWERCVREVMAGKGSRGKLESMKMLAMMRREEGIRLPLKPWLAPLVELLEDGDGPVREQAREVLVAMLSPSSTPPAARSELKKLLTARNVRKTIADPILNRIFSAPPTVEIAASIPLPEDAPYGEINRSATATPAGDDIPIVHIASSRDLEGEFAAMMPNFEGKETEHNWLPREKATIRVRGMLRGNAHQHFKEAFLAGLKAGMMEGFLKTILSLRTTVAQQSCAILQELAEHLGSSLDPFVETILPVLGKLAGLTKKIIAEKSQRALVAYMCHTTCPPRMFINHFSSTISDKNLQIRHYTASHMKVYLDVQGQRTKSSIETSPGLLDMLEGTVKRGLSDVNPGVRELARAAFWSFTNIWPTRGKGIMEGLDGIARKQLEKLNPGATLTQEIIAPTRPVPAKRSTTMSALLAEKRRAAKAAESAAGSSEQIGSPRIVSNPVPGSPSLPQPTPRATSSTYTTPLKNRMTRSITSPATTSSPKNPTPTRMLAAGPSTTTPKLVSKSGLSSPHDSARSRSSSLARTISGSPPPPVSPSVRSSLRTKSQREANSTRSSSAATVDSLRTPTLKRKPIPSYENGLGLGIRDTSATNNADIGTTPSRPSGRLAKSPPREVLDDALKAQAAQALSAAEQLVEYHEDHNTPNSSSLGAPTLSPSTPAKPILSPLYNGSGLRGDLLRTPINGSNVRGIWEDSPRNQAVTPKFLEKLKGRRYERSWWARQQQMLEKASPLKQNGGMAGTESVQADIDALENGTPSIRNLQKLVLFSGENRIPTDSNTDEDDIADAKGVWTEARLFERIFEGLMRVFTPTQPKDILEQALGLLWEMVQNQWPMFEDKETSLMDALFRLRACDSHTILESTYSLLSLLTEASDQLILLGIIQSSLDRFLASQLTSDLSDSVSSLTVSDAPPPSSSQIHTSALIFALNGLGMCILHLPAPVVLVEASRLESLIMTSLSDSAISVRQAANTLIIAIQSIILDSNKTLALLPRMDQTQRNLVTYLMETNGVLEPAKGSDVEGRKERVLGEMNGLMARSMS